MSTPKVTQSTPKASSPNVLQMSPTLESALRGLSEMVCYIQSTSEIARIHPHDLRKYKIPTMSCRTFVSEAFRFLKVGNIPVARAWMEWPERRTVYDLVYAPGQPRFTPDRFTPDGNLNTWFPPAITAKAGDAAMLLEYLDKMFVVDAMYKAWFIASLAYPMQHPGAKLHTASLFWSAQQGNGKSTLGWILRQLYGLHNSALVDATSIGRNFNSWAENVQLVVIDEMKVAISRPQADELKSLVTRLTMTINSKYRTPYETRDTINYYFSSNHPNALYLDPADRRFFVHNVGAGCTQAWLREFWAWLQMPDTLPAILDYLLHVDLSKPVAGGDPFSDDPAPFRPTAAAPRTVSRQEMIAASREDIEAWFDEFLDCMDDDAPTIWTMEGLYAQFTAGNAKARESQQMFTRRLKPRVTALYGGNSVPLSPNGKNRKRLYLIKGDLGVWSLPQLVEFYHKQHFEVGGR